MIRILRELSTQTKKLKSGDKHVTIKKTEVSGFRVKDNVKIRIVGDSYVSVDMKRSK